jgi:alpha-D-xyloside xylohydrolase
MFARPLLLSCTCAAVARASVLVEPWGRDSLRVRIAPGSTAPIDIPSALLARPASFAPAFAEGGSVLSGNLRVDDVGSAQVFTRVSDGKVLLSLESVAWGMPMPMHSLPQVNASFSVGSAEAFGLGQFRQACYSDGGMQTPPLGRVFVPGSAYSLDLSRGEGGAANTLPWLTGAEVGAGAEWGLFMNVPAMGTAVFDATAAANRTVTWNLAAAFQFDFLVTTTPAAGSPSTSFFDILENFVAWVGTTPAPPAYTLGYWHSKNRYRSQSELLEAAHGFANRSIPVDIIVIDWLHWKVQGDWHFDADNWPDPTAMVSELATLGMRVMVTVWPWSHNGSLSYDTMRENNFLLQAVAGTSTPNAGECPAGELCPPGIVTIADGLHGSLVDVTNPAARDYVWSMVMDGYVKHGIEIFWLDSSEPENFVFPQWGQVHWQNATYGNSSFPEGATMAEMGQLFTNFWTQTFVDGTRSIGAPTVLLARAAYAGAWRNGAAIWSGDIWCSFEVLQTQVRTGLSAQTSGYGLFTTDIGGFTDGGPGTLMCDPSNSTYRELVTRWFQYGVTCPIFRQHGSRATEPWGYGDESLSIISDLIKWRVSIKGYLAQEMAKMSASGRPINRPLSWDFPGDEQSWGVDDEYMFGDAFLAAPVLVAGAVSRQVYLPPLDPGGQWRHVFTGALYAGGATYSVSAPLDSLPLFQRLSPGQAII